jgi:hypothetical protein
MLGNVWEWVQDYYDENYYSISQKKNPKGPPTGEWYVRRSASWANEKKELYVSYRWHPVGADFSASDLGFRCALAASEAAQDGEVINQPATDTPIPTPPSSPSLTLTPLNTKH